MFSLMSLTKKNVFGHYIQFKTVDIQKKRQNFGCPLNILQFDMHHSIRAYLSAHLRHAFRSPLNTLPKCHAGVAHSSSKHGHTHTQLCRLG